MGKRVFVNFIFKKRAVTVLKLILFLRNGTSYARRGGR